MLPSDFVVFADFSDNGESQDCVDFPALLLNSFDRIRFFGDTFFLAESCSMSGSVPSIATFAAVKSESVSLAPLDVVASHSSHKGTSVQVSDSAAGPSLGGAKLEESDLGEDDEGGFKRGEGLLEIGRVAGARISIFGSNSTCVVITGMTGSGPVALQAAREAS